MDQEDFCYGLNRLISLKPPMATTETQIYFMSEICPLGHEQNVCSFIIIYLVHIQNCRGHFKTIATKHVERNTPKLLYFFFSLQVLELFGCFNITAKAVISIINHCRSLIILNLGQCWKVRLLSASLTTAIASSS